MSSASVSIGIFIANTFPPGAVCQSAISITSVTSSCSCTNLDMKPKAVKKVVKKAAVYVTPGHGRVEQFRLGTSSCSCTNLDMKPKTVEKVVKKVAAYVTPVQGGVVQVGDQQLLLHQPGHETQGGGGRGEESPADCLTPGQAGAVQVGQ